MNKDENRKPNPLYDSPSLKTLFKPDNTLETELMAVVLNDHPYHEFLVGLNERCGFLTASQLAITIQEFDNSFEHASGKPADDIPLQVRSYPIEIAEGWESPQQQASRLVILDCTDNHDKTVTISIRRQAEMLAENVSGTPTVPGTFHQEWTGASNDYRRFNQSAVIDKRFIETITIPESTPICVVFHKAYLR